MTNEEMEERRIVAEDESSRTTREIVGKWAVYTTVDADGTVITRVGYPTSPIVSAEFLDAMIETEVEASSR